MNTIKPNQKSDFQKEKMPKEMIVLDFNNYAPV